VLPVGTYPSTKGCGKQSGRRCRAGGQAQPGQLILLCAITNLSSQGGPGGCSASNRWPELPAETACRCCPFFIPEPFSSAEQARATPAAGADVPGGWMRLRQAACGLSRPAPHKPAWARIAPASTTPLTKVAVQPVRRHPCARGLAARRLPAELGSSDGVKCQKSLAGRLRSAGGDDPHPAPPSPQSIRAAATELDQGLIEDPAAGDYYRR